ncbi:hypothetical protein BpHYR1_017213 [Brachionus plicatilis]|uniref:Uncharacterized protein n=1 Tax=Brachionus plicatilis TaxID=10195 RepID=A0A3M7QQY4_BRAPC|nr:hypothetical protein BpHYR1_017213 [Brachionus plicatilis]
MSQTDKLKLARWRQVSKNPEFEDPTDPFLSNRRRYNVELNRYLSNVNLNYMPPMPRPVYKNSSQIRLSTNRDTDIRNNIFRNHSNRNLCDNKNSLSLTNSTNLNQMNVTQSVNFSEKN